MGLFQLSERIQVLSEVQISEGLLYILCTYVSTYISLCYKQMLCNKYISLFDLFSIYVHSCFFIVYNVSVAVQRSVPVLEAVCVRSYQTSMPRGGSY